VPKYFLPLNFITLRKRLKMRKFNALAFVAATLLSVTNMAQAFIDTVPGLSVKLVKVADLPSSSTVAGASKANINVMTRHPAITGSAMNDWITVVDGRGSIHFIDPSGKYQPQLIVNLTSASPGLNVGNSTAGNSELGVRGFAYHPDFANSAAQGYLTFYTMSCHYTSTRTLAGAIRLNHNVPPGAPAPVCDNILTEWKMVSATNLTADPRSRREVLRFPQLHGNHGTDALVFDPVTKWLYIAAGDGGSQGDPYNVASNVEYLYGKILRINPLQPGVTIPSNMLRAVDGAWSFPASNPGAGSKPGRIAYYVKGLRHPETMFLNGSDLVIADIGGSAFEEINILKLSGDEGVDFGWKAVEGTWPTTTTTIPPVAGYTHGENGGRSAIIVGGVPVDTLGSEFNGKLILGDIVTGDIFYGDLEAMKAARSWTKPMVVLKKMILLNSYNQETTLMATYGQNGRVDLRLAEIGGTIYGVSKQKGVMFRLVPIVPPPVDTPVDTNWPFSNATSITIPSAGTQGTGSIYPSAINVEGVTGTVTNVKVELNSLSHTWSRDIDVVLVGPGGQAVKLMSDAGFTLPIRNVNLTFVSNAITPLPTASNSSSQIVSDVFVPADAAIGAADNFPTAPATANTAETDLGVFNNISPNGDWKLYILDDAPADIGSLAGGWKLTLTTH
jgi:subtilisin-like proprotein convertase family protein